MYDALGGKPHWHWLSLHHLSYFHFWAEAHIRKQTLCCVVCNHLATKTLTRVQLNWVSIYLCNLYSGPSHQTSNSGLHTYALYILLLSNTTGTHKLFIGFNSKFLHIPFHGPDRLALEWRMKYTIRIRYFPVWLWKSALPSTRLFLFFHPFTLVRCTTIKIWEIAISSLAEAALELFSNHGRQAVSKQLHKHAIPEFCLQDTTGRVC